MLTAACPDTVGQWGTPGAAHAHAGSHAQPDGWGAGAQPPAGLAPAVAGPRAAHGPGNVLHAVVGAVEPGPKPPGYYWGSPFSQPAAVLGGAAAVPSVNGSLPSTGAHPHMAGPGPGPGRGPGPGYLAPHAAPGHVHFQGGVGFAHHGAYAPQPAAYGGGGGDAGFDDTPMSPPEEERGAPPTALAPSAAQKTLHETLDAGPSRDRGVDAAARTGGARAPEESARAPDAAASKRPRLHHPAPDLTPNGLCSPALDSVAPLAANGHGSGGAHGGAPSAREGEPNERLAGVAAAAAAVAAGQVRNPI